MIRAFATLMGMTFLVVVLGTPILLIGLIYPSRQLFAWGARVWCALVLAGTGVRLRVLGEMPSPAVPRFYVANHQSALDIPILVSLLRGHVRLMAKESLFRIPIFGWAIRRYGFVPVSRGNARKTLRKLEAMLTEVKQNPISFAVFPEGTRSRDGRLLDFRAGTLKVCQRSGLDIVPVVIDGSICVHHRDRFRATPGEVRVIFTPPIPHQQAAAMSSIELRDFVVGIIASHLKSTDDSARVVCEQAHLLGAQAS